MTDVVDLCANIENMIRTADPSRRRAVARAFSDRRSAGRRPI